MTVATDLATILKTAYTDSEQTSATSVAESLLSGVAQQTITSNQDDGWDTAIIELAIKILQFGSKAEDDKVNPENINFRNLITKEMRKAVSMEISEETDSFIFKNKSPSRTWEGF